MIRSDATIMTNYIIRFDIAASLILIAVMLSYFREKRIKTKISDSFTALTWQCFSACILDITSVQLLNIISPSNLWINYIVLIAYYIMFNAMPLLYYMCFWFLSERNRKMPLKQYWIMFDAAQAVLVNVWHLSVLQFVYNNIAVYTSCILVWWKSDIQTRPAFLWLLCARYFLCW